MIRILVSHTPVGFSEKFFGEVLDYAIQSYCRKGEAENVSVDLRVVSDSEITAMNMQYKAKDCPTDVLAFYDGEKDPDSKEVHLGDVVISSDTALSEAEARGVKFAEELLLYAVHGVLHLSGLLDGSDTEKDEMRSAERDVLAKFGIKPHW